MNKILEFFLGNRTPAYSNKLSNQFSLTCRVLVGGYVAYLGMGLKDAVKNATTSTNRAMFLIALIVFAVVGALLVYASIRDFILGRYVGGKLDLGEEPEDEEVHDEIDIYEEIIEAEENTEE